MVRDDQRKLLQLLKRSPLIFLLQGKTCHLSTKRERTNCLQPIATSNKDHHDEMIFTSGQWGSRFTFTPITLGNVENLIVLYWCRRNPQLVIWKHENMHTNKYQSIIRYFFHQSMVCWIIDSLPSRSRFLNVLLQTVRSDNHATFNDCSKAPNLWCFSNEADCEQIKLKTTTKKWKVIHKIHLHHNIL